MSLTMSLIMSRTLLTTAQVAARLGHPGAAGVAWFYRHRRALRADRFPEPVTGCGYRWDPAAIDAWLDGDQPHSAAQIGGPEFDPGVSKRLAANADAIVEAIGGA